MEEQDAIYHQIINDSKKKLLTLELLSNFFNHKDLIGALLKTKIIHQLFESNKQLDINKLELFHLQYTKSLIDLAQKLKKSKEQQYLLVSDEIYINEDFIAKLELELKDSDFTKQIRVHAKNMSQKIEQIYQLLVSEKQAFFSWDDIVNFSRTIHSEFYREINAEQYGLLTNINKSVYQNAFVKIERKLLGRLNILKFKIKFLCGLVCNHDIIEVYEFRDSNDRFMFIEKTKSFYFLDEALAKGIDLSNNISNKQQVINELKNKNALLKEQLGKIKTTLPENVQEVLKSYLAKISSVDFLNELQNVDEQTNILKTMLNFNIK